MSLHYNKITTGEHNLDETLNDHYIKIFKKLFGIKSGCIALKYSIADDNDSIQCMIKHCENHPSNLETYNAITPWNHSHKRCQWTF